MAWLTGWTYRKQITVDNTSNSNALTDYQIRIDLDNTNFNFSKANSNGSDIRFTDDDETTLLSYWIEKYDNTNQKAIIWVKIPSISANSTKTIYLYYGNASATSESNGDNVFEFFDDFDGSNLDAGKWTITQGDVSLSDSNLVLQGTSGTRAFLEGKKSLLPDTVILETRAKWNQNTGYFSHFCSFYKSGDGSTKGGDIYNSSIAGQVVCMTDNNGSYVTKSVNISNPQDFHIYAVIWTSSKVSFFQDTTSLAQITSDIPTVENVPIFQEGSHDSFDTYVDWIRIRKYTSTEPTNSVGSEEVVNVPSYNAIMFGANF